MTSNAIRSLLSWRPDSCILFPFNAPLRGMIKVLDTYYVLAGPTSPGSSSAAPGASNQSGAPLLDETLLRQIGPALTGTHVRSVLAQPLMGSDEKVGLGGGGGHAASSRLGARHSVASASVELLWGSCLDAANGRCRRCVCAAVPSSSCALAGSGACPAFTAAVNVFTSCFSNWCFGALLRLGDAHTRHSMPCQCGCGWAVSACCGACE